MLTIDSNRWRFAGFYYLGTCDVPMPEWEPQFASCRTALAHCARPAEARSATRGLAPGLTGICDHCGRSHSWGVVLIDAGGHAITVSQRCAESALVIPDADYLQYCQAVVHVRAANKRRAEVWKHLRQLVSVLRKCPAVCRWLRSDQTLARDLRARLFRWGWSRKQVKLVCSASERFSQSEQGISRHPMVHPAAPAPTGRWEGQLQLLMVKNKVTRFGSQLKGLWIHPIEGWRVWASLPKGFDRKAIGLATLLRLTLTPNSSDPTFAWGKRPLALSAA